jgi:hypothetical protein
MFSTPIFVPSRSRFFRINKGVLTKLPPEILKWVNLVVPADQAKDYMKHIQVLKTPLMDLVCLESDGIAATRHDIGKFSKINEYSKFIMLDDDLTDWATRIEETSHKLRRSTPEDLIEMFEWVQSTLDSYAHVSISPRGNNMIRKSEGIWVGPKPLTMENVRTIRFLAYQTDAFLSVEHGRVPIMEDFDVNLQLLEKGHKNIQSYWWTQDQRQTALPGGCSDYRSLEVHDAGARKLAELHPNSVKLRTKINKSNVTYNKEFTERTEVTIQWKKTYKAASAKL